MFPQFQDDDGPDRILHRGMRKGEVAVALGVSYARVSKLAAAGVLRMDSGSPHLFDGELVAQLAKMRWLRVVSGELTVLRTDAQGANGYPNDPRQWEGFHTQMTDLEVSAACLRWWRSDPARVCDNQLFVVTIATFPVAVFTVNRDLDAADPLPQTIRVPHETFDRHRYNGVMHARIKGDGSVYVDPGLPDELDRPVRQIMRKRINTTSGGPIAYLDVDS